MSSVVHEPARAEHRPGLEWTRLEAPLDSRTRTQRHLDSARLEPARAAKRIERTRADSSRQETRAEWSGLEPPRDSSLLEPARVVLLTSRLTAPPDSSPELSGCLCMLPLSFETTTQELTTRHLNINTVDLSPLAMYLLHR